jgi:hypothetical protein
LNKEISKKPMTSAFRNLLDPEYRKKITKKYNEKKYNEREISNSNKNITQKKR